MLEDHFYESFCVQAHGGLAPDPPCRLYPFRSPHRSSRIPCAPPRTRPAPPTPQAPSPAPPPGSGERVKREIRITGLIQAVPSVKIFVPQIQGQFNTMTLTQLVDNGTHVAQGGLIATFDPAQQLDAARDAKAKFDDLEH